MISLNKFKTHVQNQIDWIKECEFLNSQAVPLLEYLNGKLADWSTIYEAKEIREKYNISIKMENKNFVLLVNSQKTVIGTSFVNTRSRVFFTADNIIKIKTLSGVMAKRRKELEKLDVNACYQHMVQLESALKQVTDLLTIGYLKSDGIIRDMYLGYIMKPNEVIDPDKLWLLDDVWKQKSAIQKAPK